MDIDGQQPYAFNAHIDISTSPITPINSLPIAWTYKWPEDNKG